MVANGALTLQVARSLQRLNLHWGRDIGLLGFDELEWAICAWPYAAVTTMMSGFMFYSMAGFCP